MNETSRSSDDDRILRSSILADPRQRRILAIFIEHAVPMTERDVAVRLAARERDEDETDVPEEHVEELLVELHHQWLPKLADVDWIELHPEGMVTLDRPPFRGTAVQEALTDDSDRKWETMAAVLARPRRRQVLSVIADQDRPIELDELADEIHARGGVPQEGSLELPALLHHVDLPQLDDAGVVAYDSDAKAVTPAASLPSLVSWIDDGL